MNLNYSKTAWHFKIFLLGNSKYRQAYKEGEFEDGLQMDFCVYWRLVLYYALIKIPAMSAIAGVFLFIIGTAIYNNPVGTVVGFLITVAILGSCELGGYFIGKWIDKRKEKLDSQEYKPPFLIEAYRSFKEKTCRMVTIK